MGSSRFRSIFCGPNYVSPASIGRVSRSHRGPYVHTLTQTPRVVRKALARNTVRGGLRGGRLSPQNIINEREKKFHRTNEHSRRPLSFLTSLFRENLICFKIQTFFFLFIDRVPPFFRKLGEKDKLVRQFSQVALLGLREERRREEKKEA